MKPLSSTRVVDGEKLKRIADKIENILREECGGPIDGWAYLFCFAEEYRKVYGIAGTTEVGRVDVGGVGGHA